MRFGPVAIADAEDALLAHSLALGTLKLKKGHRLTASDLMMLEQGGVTEVIAARLDPGDVAEDAAAEALAQAFGGAHIRAANASTGRVNLHAERAGLFRAERLLVDHFNAIDPAITFACLADQTPVQPGEMVATIKIIPLAVPGASLKRAQAAIETRTMARILPFRRLRVGLIATTLPGLKASVMDKTRAMLDSRLALTGLKLSQETRVAHAEADLGAELARMAAREDLIVVFGASAVIDPADVIPAAIRAAGGMVERVGMPVDPGNLLVLGRVGDATVIGAPGCARSPKVNGFDWVLHRLLTGQQLASQDISRMGVGGLLKEIPSRPHPRQAGESDVKVGAETEVGVVLLAAGRASRMGEAAGHKLLATFGGEVLIRRMAETALASQATRTVVVTGHRGADIARQLEGLDVELVSNPDYAAGMATSLRCGLAALDGRMAGALVLLGDMPAIEASHLDALIERFSSHGGQAIVRACDGARRGNPVILPRAAFAEAMQLSGDVGARALIESGAWSVVDVEIGPAARLDVDTPEAVRRAGGATEIT
ncbi:NTP transferase domain-containing protein [Hoeflea olei]|uniref:4-diphosphocytidyl-2C-methyl-D-erythritol kinase n=1 Tax=Hoeflea olei TaxID=1480615 RepID=A0A1C1YYV7_9HYPH|nr:molybdopterin-binding/glycosyltransferase family 2 protein [Hoeflea olei]OCW58711.1 4-diphosphocytidyl-2C-methyl-D-erythritol kinase [Hoeflea olei]